MEKTVEIINSAIEHCNKQGNAPGKRYPHTAQMLHDMKASLKHNPAYTAELIKTIAQAITVDQTGKAINEQ